MFAIGGRSLFWGGLIPRMCWWELDAWPQDIRWYLEGVGYNARSSWSTGSPPPTPTTGAEIRQAVRAGSPTTPSTDAPMAVDYGRGGPLLADGSSRLQSCWRSQCYPGATGNDNLAVAANHAVHRVLLDGGTGPTGVVARDWSRTRCGS